MKKPDKRRAQSVIELAVFASLILLAFGVLLSYLQRLNNEQYLQMETFRRTLQKAHPSEEGPGASVQVVNLENRHQVDVSGDIGKVNPQGYSVSSSVFWATPRAEEEARDLTVLRVNDDERQWEKKVSIGEIGAIKDNSSLNETDIKKETFTGITTTRTSTFEDTITTTVKDDKGKEIWKVRQGAYRDDEGQYGYSKDQVGTEVIRGRSWETDF